MTAFASANSATARPDGEDEAAQRAYVAAARTAAWRRRLLPAVAALLIVALWQAGVTWWHIRPFIAPAPSAVLNVLYAKFGLLMANLGPTAFEALLGFVIGNALGILTATLFVHVRIAEEAFFPIAIMVHTIPVMAYAPILVLLLGNGLSAKVAIAALICYFPTLVNMTRGLRAVSPYVIGAIVGEWIGATTGIGALIIQATYNFDSPLLYATIVVGSLFSIAFFGVISWAETRFLRWNQTDAG
jgi:NitT/TauT family transport system permease protein